MAIRELLRIKTQTFTLDIIWKFMPRRATCMSVFRDYIETQRYLNGIIGTHLTLQLLIVSGLWQLTHETNCADQFIPL